MKSIRVPTFLENLESQRMSWNFRIAWIVREFQNWSEKNVNLIKNCVLRSVGNAGEGRIDQSIDLIAKIVKLRVSVVF